jgi:hypothetical protein
LGTKPLQKHLIKTPVGKNKKIPLILKNDKEYSPQCGPLPICDIPPGSLIAGEFVKERKLT